MTGKQFYKWRVKQKSDKKEVHRGVQIDHMNQEEAGEYFGVTRQTVTNWERGETSVPRFVEMMIDGQ